MVTNEYIAGFFDGEGSISINKIRNEEDNAGYCLQIYIGQVSKLPLDKICERFGGTVRVARQSGRNPIFYWRLSSKDALKFLVEIEPFLILKKEEALIAFEFMELRGTKGKEFIKKKDDLRNKLMNHRKSIKSSTHFLAGQKNYGSA